MGDTGVSKPPRLPKSAPRVRLSIVGGPGAGNAVELTRCVSLIGSRAGCKLQLRSTEVSAVHAAIVNTGEDVYLRDLASTNGTFLNNLPARFEKLTDGDTMHVADWELRVNITAYTLDTLSDLPHVSLEPEPMAFGIEVNGTGKLSRLTKAVGVVGRREGCDVIVNDNRVSRVHLLLFTFSGRPVYYDLLSHNGVVLEGVRCSFAELHSGDVLDLGGIPVRIILPGVPRRTSTSTPPARGEADGSTGTNVRVNADRSGTRSGSGSSTSSGTVAARGMDDTGDGTVVYSSDDNKSDRVDIRAAEMD